MSSVTIPVVEHGYYAILEVSPSATKEQIRKSYRRLALLWHPDKRPASDVEATQKFQKINNAHEVLSHESARARYDGSVYNRLCQVESLKVRMIATLARYRQKQQDPTMPTGAYSGSIEKAEKYLADLKDERSRLRTEITQPPSNERGDANGRRPSTRTPSSSRPKQTRGRDYGSSWHPQREEREREQVRRARRQAREARKREYERWMRELDESLRRQREALRAEYEAHRRQRWEEMRRRWREAQWKTRDFARWMSESAQ